MTTTPKPITPAQLTNAAATYYTAPALTTAIIKKLTFCNTDTVAHTVTVYRIPSGGTASTTNEVVKTRSIAAGDTYECFEMENQVLAAGDFIQALAETGAQVGIQGSVIEVV